MSFYAESPTTRNRQILGDGLFAAWCWLCASVGGAVNDAISTLAGPGRSLVSTADSLREQAISLERSLPSFLNISTDRLEDAAGSLQNTAQDSVESVERIATIVGWTVALIPIVVVGIFHLTHRYRWWRRYSAALTLRKSPQFDKLMALRALVTAPVLDLRKVSEDPVGDFESGRYAALAAIETKALGLTPPQESSPPS